ncbi:lysine--tRNA ligase [Candidatus Microgenomates bacterium]|nr:lysine--tRNA ligase [Candidatus Microgenomates bacterium]
MAGRLSHIKENRLEKLGALRKLGVEIYPANTVRKQTISQALASFGKKVAIVGRIWAIRSHGGAIFADVHDELGDIQVLLVRNKLSPKEFSLAQLLDSGDFINVQGSVIKTNSGEITVQATHLILLAKALRPLPSSWSGFRDVEERYRQRYADLLLNPQVKEVALTRSRIIKSLREFLDKAGFMEVETPILQPLYGGAVAKPFTTHHNALDSDFYLRISDELYLKRLIVGGFEKVYEIGHNFRNEGIDKSHNPEFTMVEFYWAYQNYEGLMDFTEKLITTIIETACGKLKLIYQGQSLDFTPPWPRVTYRDALLAETGIDINLADTEAKLKTAIKQKNIKLDLKNETGLPALLAQARQAGFGNVLDALYKATTRPKLVGPIFLIDRPTAFVSLAKRKPDDPAKTASFQLLVAGLEVVNAYNELNDPVDQAKRWQESEKRKKSDHEAFDADYIRALEYGMPPTAGWGMGIDRFVALLTDQATLKDVILFPTLRPKNDNQG